MIISKRQQPPPYLLSLPVLAAPPVAAGAHSRWRTTRCRCATASSRHRCTPHHLPSPPGLRKERRRKERRKKLGHGPTRPIAFDVLHGPVRPEKRLIVLCPRRWPGTKHAVARPVRAQAVTGHAGPLSCRAGPLAIYTKRAIGIFNFFFLPSMPPKPITCGSMQPTP